MGIKAVLVEWNGDSHVVDLEDPWDKSAAEFIDYGSDVPVSLCRFYDRFTRHIFLADDDQGAYSVDYKNHCVSNLLGFNVIGDVIVVGVIGDLDHPTYVGLTQDEADAFLALFRSMQFLGFPFPRY